MKHAYEPRECKFSDLGTAKGEDADELVATLDKYLSDFAAPATDEDGKPVCFNCGKRVDGMMAVLGVAVAYQWGLAHGEANCSGCGWPARGMHYIKDEGGEEILTMRNLFLAYHPKGVSSKREEAA